MEDKFFEAKYPKEAWKNEISQIISFIDKGDSCQIIGIPGVGRSNLLGLLAYNQHVREFHLGERKENYHFVMLSFFEIKNKPQVEAIKLIFLNLVASLEDRKLGDTYEKAKHIMFESFSLHDELVLLHGIKRVIDLITLAQNKTLVLLFDQFDSYVPMLTSDLFANLKILRNRAKYKFSIVFSLHKPLEYLLDPLLFADFAEFVEDNDVYLSLCDTPSDTFRLAYIEHALGKTLDKERKKILLDVTAGHSKLTRLGLQSLLSQEKIPEDISSYLLSQKHIHTVLTDIWTSLNPAEQTHFIKKLYPSVLDDEHSQYLHKVGLMNDTTVTLPLFSSFIQTLGQSHTTNESPITYNPQTKTIQKGTLLLSDQLTSTEFRLLKFFLENVDHILDRNDIITAVWQENKSLAGVSDQALDQLIFRLRKKIEDDPNNPTHIQTVKGRGFKFIT